MDFTIEWGGYPQDVLVRTTGEASAEGSVKTVDALLLDPRFRPGMKVLIDHSGLEDDHVTEEDVIAVAQNVLARREQIEGTIIAVVTPSELLYTSSRRWRTYAQEALLITVGVFYSHAAATEWLSRVDSPTESA